MTISDKYKQEFFKQETDEVFNILLTFSSDELTDDIRVCYDPYEILPIANVEGTVSNGLEYIYAPFDIQLPKDDKTGVVSAKIIIDNIDQSVIGHLREVSKPVDVNIKTVLSNDPDYVEKEYKRFKLDNVSYDLFSIEGSLTMDYWGLEPFPSGRFTPAGFPGLF